MRTLPAVVDDGRCRQSPDGGGRAKTVTGALAAGRVAAPAQPCQAALAPVGVRFTDPRRVCPDLSKTPAPSSNAAHIGHDQAFSCPRSASAYTDPAATVAPLRTRHRFTAIQGQRDDAV